MAATHDAHDAIQPNDDAATYDAPADDASADDAVPHEPHVHANDEPSLDV